MKIDWSSSYKPDGSPRRPPPNALHGWLAKMRGTLAGNEDLRSRGMKEMRAAQHYKDQQRERARKARGNGFLGLFITKDEPKASSGRPQRRLTREDRSMSYSSRKSTSSSKRPPPSRRGTMQSTRSTKSMPGSWPSDAPRSRPTPSRKSSRK